MSASRLWWIGVLLGFLGITGAYGLFAGLCLAGAAFVVAAVVAYLDGDNSFRSIDREYGERRYRSMVGSDHGNDTKT